MIVRVPPARVLAPQRGRSLRRRRQLDGSELLNDDAVITTSVKPHDAHARTRVWSQKSHEATALDLPLLVTPMTKLCFAARYASRRQRNSLRRPRCTSPCNVE